MNSEDTLPEGLWPQPEAIGGLIDVRSETYYELTAGTVTIGRDSKCTIELSDSRVSRLHCEIIVGERGVCRLRDLDSTGGTTVNHRRVGPGGAPLFPTANIMVGSTLFVAVSADEVLPWLKQGWLKRAWPELVSGLVDVTTMAYYELTAGTVTIGRDGNCTIQLSDPCVSQLHCEISVGERGIRWLRDLNSTGGTTVNHRRVGPEGEPFFPTANIMVGNTLFVAVSADKVSLWLQRGWVKPQGFLEEAPARSSQQTR